MLHIYVNIKVVLTPESVPSSKKNGQILTAQLKAHMNLKL